MAIARKINGAGISTPKSTVSKVSIEPMEASLRESGCLFIASTNTDFSGFRDSFVQ
jgi:hypothetical protein